MDVKASSNYHDFSGLASLRKDANENAEEAIAPVAKQFEALFLQMMLKSMRAGVPEGGLFSDESSTASCRSPLLSRAGLAWPTQFRRSYGGRLPLLTQRAQIVAGRV
jgi:hypothetical protein